MTEATGQEVINSRYHFGSPHDNCPRFYEMICVGCHNKVIKSCFDMDKDTGRIVCTRECLYRFNLLKQDG